MLPSAEHEQSVNHFYQFQFRNQALTFTSEGGGGSASPPPGQTSPSAPQSETNAYSNWIMYTMSQTRKLPSLCRTCIKY